MGSTGLDSIETEFLLDLPNGIDLDWVAKLGAHIDRGKVIMNAAIISVDT